MALRRWLSLLLVAVLFAVSPLAYSEAPDDVWLGGYYDGGEADDALIDLQLHHSAIAMLAVYVSPSITLVPTPPPLSERVPALRALLATHTRAPPLS
jgi:hypothetical protein